MGNNCEILLLALENFHGIIFVLMLKILSVYFFSRCEVPFAWLNYYFPITHSVAEQFWKQATKFVWIFFVSDTACKEACWRIKLFRNGLDLFFLSKFLCPVKGECTFSITKLYKQICIISLLLQPFFLIKQRLYTIHSLTLSQHCG